MSRPSPDLDRYLLTRWERLRQDPDWDAVNGYREADDKHKKSRPANKKPKQKHPE